MATASIGNSLFGLGLAQQMCAREDDYYQLAQQQRDIMTSGWSGGLTSGTTHTHQHYSISLGGLGLSDVVEKPTSNPRNRCFRDELREEIDAWLA